MINMLSVAIFCGLFIASLQSSRDTKNASQQSSRDTKHASKQPSSDTKDVCWTQWYDRDNPSGSGDWETLTKLRNEHPGKICSSPTAIEVETLNGLSVAATRDVIYKQDTTSGLICRNKDQADGKKCSDYRVRFSCPDSYCDTDVCWTKWYDRDDASGTGDWECLADFQTEKPGEICPNPVDIEAQTLNGLSVAEAGDVIHKRDTTTGFVCRNEDQPDGKKCNDYRVRFRCPSSYCAKHACWTQWYDRDDPLGNGTGDWECLADFYKENPGKICPDPVAIEAQTLTGLSVAEAGDVIYKMDTTSGFVCRNEDQPSKQCNDYRVRFSCPSSYCDTQVCWTAWYDRDDPKGSGDKETLSYLHKDFKGRICKNPLSIEAVTVDQNIPAASTGDIFKTLSPSKGLECRNKDQKSKSNCKGSKCRKDQMSGSNCKGSKCRKDQKDGSDCNDYKVRFGCPC